MLCRTSPENVKHAGISFLLVPMDQPGIEVRPIINIVGGHEFNEVFFTDARTAKANVIGEVDNGWAVANTLLGFERGGRATSLYITYREELDRLTGRRPGAWCHRAAAGPPEAGLVPQPGRGHALHGHAHPHPDR